MGSPCLFTRQRAFKMEYFYWLRVKNSNHLHKELSLGYLEDAKYYLESKASFIEVSSIFSFKLFLIAWFREYCTFSDSSVVSLKSSPWPKYTQLGTIFQKKIVFHFKLFFFFKYVLYEPVLSKYPRPLPPPPAPPPKKNRGSSRSFKRKGEFISLSS